MNDWHETDKAVLIAHPRSGSTFLASALDSHPQIGFERGEPLSSGQAWLQEFPDQQYAILRACLSRPGYAVSGVRITYKTLPNEFWLFAQKHNIKIIHLHRENLLRVIVSAQINSLVHEGKLDHPHHTYFKPQKHVSVYMDIQKAQRTIIKLQGMINGVRKAARESDLPRMMLTYEDIIGSMGQDAHVIRTETGNALCEFLGVRHRALHSVTRRVNPFKLSDMVENWIAFKTYFEMTPYAKYLKGED